ncbi:MAG TPA: hypothetical protein VHZ07_14860 [Bryobacteraceae bacterium]|jgi:hypothetical protein|nr:hypothetical protein [Bryobacteraceae bacterium]
MDPKVGFLGASSGTNSQVIVGDFEISVRRDLIELAHKAFCEDVARQASRDWLSDVQRQVEQQFSERTDSWAVSAEIETLLHERWRARLAPGSMRYSLAESTNSLRSSASLLRAN